MNNLKTNEQFENFISKLPYGKSNNSSLLVVNITIIINKNGTDYIMDKTCQEIINALFTTGAIAKTENFLSPIAYIKRFNTNKDKEEYHFHTQINPESEYLEDLYNFDLNEYPTTHN